MRRRRARDLGGLFRIAGALVIVAGLFWARSLLPHREVPWGSVVALDVSAEACEERREERQLASFTLPPSRPEPVAWAQVARWFRLDPAEVCAANGVGAADCGERRLQPGEALTLPLRHHAPGPPGRVGPRTETGR